MHVVSFQFAFKDVNDEVMSAGSSKCFHRILFCKSVVVAVILKKWPALRGIRDVTTNIIGREICTIDEN